MMETTKLSLAEQLKMELMERYGLREDQVKIEIGIYTDNLELGRQILAENDMYSTKKKEYLKEGKTCDNSYGEHIDCLWVYKKGSRSDFLE